MLRHLRYVARRLAEEFGLGSFRLEADRRNARRYGACYRDGVIRIRLVDRRNSQALKSSSLIYTLCHELAHLRHFNHGPGFKAFYFSLVRFAREHGIYRPDPVRPAAAARTSAKRAPDRPPPTTAPAPAQLPLFA